MVAFLPSCHLSQPYCEALDKEEYPLKALAPVGFATLEMIKRNYESNIDRKLRRQLRELKDEEYVEFFLRATCADTSRRTSGILQRLLSESIACSAVAPFSRR